VGRSTKVATSIWYTPSQRRWRRFTETFWQGADVIETDTFGAASIVLAEYDLADQAYSLNKTAQLAKRVAAEFSPEKLICRWVNRTHDETANAGAY